MKKEGRTGIGGEVGEGSQSGQRCRIDVGRRGAAIGSAQAAQTGLVLQTGQTLQSCTMQQTKKWGYSWLF